MKKSIRLNRENLAHIEEGVDYPTYDREKVTTGIVHVGIGGFHRSHQALYCNELLQDGKNSTWGICGVALLERDDAIYNTLKEQDGLYTLIVKELDGSWNPQIIGSIVEVLFAPENPTAVIEKMARPETRIITLTITEGGYNFDETTGEFDMDDPLIQHDLLNPTSPKTIFGYLTQSLKLRKERGEKGCTVQSCDNIQRNGKVMKKTLTAYMKAAEPELVPWVDAHVSFPDSMVDRITPVTEKGDVRKLKEDFGIEDSWPVVCEPFRQWVIEDTFSAGRPEWEDVGAQFVADVAPYEKMKLRLLNAGHSVLGILGTLMGYGTIDEAVNDADIRSFLIAFMDKEATPSLGKIKGMDLNAYKISLIKRFGNHNIKDQVSRICSESSAKIPKFLVPTIKYQIENEGNFMYSAFILAAWARYSLGKNENGNAIERKDSMEALLKEKAILSKEDPLTFLSIESIFGGLKDHQNFAKSYSKSYRTIAKKGVKIGISNCL